MAMEWRPGDVVDLDLDKSGGELRPNRGRYRCWLNASKVTCGVWLASLTRNLPGATPFTLSPSIFIRQLSILSSRSKPISILSTALGSRSRRTSLVYVPCRPFTWKHPKKTNNEDLSTLTAELCPIRPRLLPPSISLMPVQSAESCTGWAAFRLFGIGASVSTCKVLHRMCSRIHVCLPHSIAEEANCQSERSRLLHSPETVVPSAFQFPMKLPTK